jgi:hypothetical protein
MRKDKKLRRRPLGNMDDYSQKLKKIETFLKTKKESSGGLYWKADKDSTTRIRILPEWKEGELYFKQIDTHFVPTSEGIKKMMCVRNSSVGYPCYVCKRLETLLAEVTDDKEINRVRRMLPVTRFAMNIVVVHDLQDLDNASVGLIYEAPKSVAYDLAELFSDMEDWGDFTDPKNGYYVKLIRDDSLEVTKYKVNPSSKRTKIPKSWLTYIKNLDEKYPLPSDRDLKFLAMKIHANDNN